MAKKSKRIRNAQKLVDAAKVYTVEEGLDIFAQYAKDGFATKFDETVECAISLGIDAKQSDQLVRGVVAMPSGLGKKVTVCVVTNADKVSVAEKAGADFAGSEDLIEKIKGGWVDFDVCIATPDVMPQLSKLGKVLGPKGLMPNPKLGTVTEDIEKAVKAAKAGQVEYKTEKAGIVHAAFGKVSFTKDALLANLKALVSALQAAKPTSSKGVYFKRAYLSTTMGLSIAVDLNQFVS